MDTTIYKMTIQTEDERGNITTETDWAAGEDVNEKRSYYCRSARPGVTRTIKVEKDS